MPYQNRKFEKFCIGIREFKLLKLLRTGNKPMSELMKAWENAYNTRMNISFFYSVIKGMLSKELISANLLKVNFNSITKISDYAVKILIEKNEIIHLHPKITEDFFSFFENYFEK